MNDNDNTQEQKFDAVIKIRKINSYQVSPTCTYVKESDTHIVYKKKNSPVRKDDNDIKDFIISYLTKYPNSKAIDIANYQKVTRKEVNSILYRLRKEGRCEINPWFQWRVIEGSSSVSVVKEPANVYKSNPSASEYIDTFAYGRIFSMRCSNRNGYRAPHKAIYLLSIIDCIDVGYITEIRFNIDSFILDRFERFWKRYVGVTCFSPSIWNPIFYMEDSIIHKEWNDGFYGVQPRTLKRCKVIFKYFEMASDLWNALQDRGVSDSIKLRLIETYIQGNVDLSGE